MPARPSKASSKPAPDPAALRRESAGTYRSGDGRFTVEQSSGRWLVIDAEQQDDLGQPLVRGPFDTLAAAKAAAADARTGPAPTSALSTRVHAGRERASAPTAGAARGTSDRPPAAKARPPEPPPIEVRRYRSGDGHGLRAL